MFLSLRHKNIVRIDCGPLFIFNQYNKFSNQIVSKIFHERLIIPRFHVACQQFHPTAHGHSTVSFSNLSRNRLVPNSRCRCLNYVLRSMPVRLVILVPHLLLPFITQCPPDSKVLLGRKAKSVMLGISIDIHSCGSCWSHDGDNQIFKTFSKFKMYAVSAGRRHIALSSATGTR